MNFNTFKHVALRGLSATVPARAVSLEDELQYYGGDAMQAERLTRISGLRTRRMAQEGVTASDLCHNAAERLLAAMEGVDRADIDAVFCVTHSADFLLPSNASLLHGLLGLRQDCLAMDMNVGCAGFVQGLLLAAGLIESGARNTVLLLVGDTPNRFQPPANRVSAPVFGDAGTAALLQRVETGGQSWSFGAGSNGAKYASLVIPGGGSRIPNCADEGRDSPYNTVIHDGKNNPWSLGGYGKIWMDAMGIYTFALSVVPGHLKKHMEFSQVTPPDMDALFLHQASKIIVRNIAQKIEMPFEKAPLDTLGIYGNLGSSSIPVAMCEHYTSNTGAGRNRIMLCAFGAGLAWASCLMSVHDTIFLPVHSYSPPETAPTRSDLIARWHDVFRDA